MQQYRVFDDLGWEAEAMIEVERRRHARHAAMSRMLSQSDNAPPMLYRLLKLAEVMRKPRKGLLDG